jgi:hypothetical protein
MTTSNGINLDGFGNTRPAGTNAINATGDYSPATGSFPAAMDKSAQGNAGLNREGSTQGTQSGPDSSDM